MAEPGSSSERTAACACGKLSVTVRGAPADVYLCGCTSCQRRSGSAFTYAALYPEPAVTIAGEHGTWRQPSEAGRLVDSSFCPTCGVSVFFRGEGLPGLVGVRVGCFAEPGFTKPSRLYWASRKHAWLELGDDVPAVDTQ
jgi:hypothetical protein